MKKYCIGLLSLVSLTVVIAIAENFTPEDYKQIPILEHIIYQPISELAEFKERAGIITNIMKQYGDVIMTLQNAASSSTSKSPIRISLGQAQNFKEQVMLQYSVCANNPLQACVPSSEVQRLYHLVMLLNQHAQAFMNLYERGLKASNDPHDKELLKAEVAQKKKLKEDLLRKIEAEKDKAKGDEKFWKTLTVIASVVVAVALVVFAFVIFTINPVFGVAIAVVGLLALLGGNFWAFNSISNLTEKRIQALAKSYAMQVRTAEEDLLLTTQLSASLKEQVTEKKIEVNSIP